MIVLVAAAGAHPVGSGFSTETTVLRVGRGRLEVRYAAEVDRALVPPPRPSGRSPLEDLAVELQTGLRLEIDHTPVPLPVGAPSLDPARSDHTVGVALVFDVPLPAGASAVAVTTTNLVDERVLRATDVWVEPSVRVDHTSVLAEREGRVVRDDGLRWSREDSRRTVDVAFHREPAAWTLAAGRGHDWVRAPAALAPRGLRRLGPGAVEPEGLALWVAATLASRAAADAPALPRVAVALAAAAAGVLLPRSGAVEAVAAAALLVAAALPGRDRAVALAAAATLTLHPAPLAALGVAVVAVPLPGGRSPRPALALAVAAGGLALRALAA